MTNQGPPGWAPPPPYAQQPHPQPPAHGQPAYGQPPQPYGQPPQPYGQPPQPQAPPPWGTTPQAQQPAQPYAQQPYTQAPHAQPPAFTQQPHPQQPYPQPPAFTQQPPAFVQQPPPAPQPAGAPSWAGTVEENRGPDEGFWEFRVRGLFGIGGGLLAIGLNVVTLLLSNSYYPKALIAGTALLGYGGWQTAMGGDYGGKGAKKPPTWKFVGLGVSVAAGVGIGIVASILLKG